MNSRQTSYLAGATAIAAIVVISLATASMLGVATADTGNESNASLPADADVYVASESVCAATADPCYQSFQEAVDFAADNDVETIYLYDAVYEESAEIYVDDVEIIGWDGTDRDAALQFEPEEPTDEHTLTISGDNVVFKHYDVARGAHADRTADSPTAAAIQVTGENVRLESLNITGPGSEVPGLQGVSVEDGGSVEIVGGDLRGEISGLDTGVAIGENADASIADDVSFSDTQTNVAGDTAPAESFVMVNDQNTTGDRLGVANASADEPYVAVVHHDGDTIGMSQEFDAGSTGGSFPIDLDTEITEDTTVEVVLHEQATNAEFGEPLVDENGNEISTVANVTHVTAYISMSTQDTDGTTLVIDEASYSESSWGIHVHRFSGGDMGEIIGTTEDFEAGETVEDVTIELEEPLNVPQNMMAMLHWGGEEVDGESDFITTADGERTIADIAVAEVDPISRYANDGDVVDTDGLQNAIADWRAGDIETDMLREVIDAWRTGEPVN